MRDALQSAYEDVVQDAVNDGVITEAQAEEILENGSAGRMFGKRGGGLGWRSGFGGRGGLFSPNADSNWDTNL